MKRAHAAAIGVLALALSTNARAAGESCATDSVRVSLVDAGATSMLEVSARVTANEESDGGSGPCALAWSRIVLASSSSSGPTPHVAIVETFVDHERIRPMLLADGLSPATPRDIALPTPEKSSVVALRLVVEDTDGGLKVTLPRSVFPAPAPWARVERRVKSARESTGKFGPIGEIAIPPSPPGPAGGLGPTGPFDADAIVVECAPSGAPPSEPLPSWTIALDAFRTTLPRRAIDLSPAADAEWDDLARHAYAAALHSDPVVASLGASSLAWLGSGFDLHTTKLDASIAPASVVSTIGDVDRRLVDRYGAVGKLLPLGRPSTFREVLRASPASDAQRVRAAKASVARLASASPGEMSSLLTPAIVEPTAPVDPPSVEPPKEAPLPSTEPTTNEPPSTAITIPHENKYGNARRHRIPRRALALASLLVALLAATTWLLFARRRAQS